MLATTIPLLPCVAPGETVEFLRRWDLRDLSTDQAVPLPRVQARRCRTALRPTGLDLDPPDERRRLPVHDRRTESLRVSTTLQSGLRLHYGSVLAKGRPRLNRIRPGQSRFQVVDPSGNCIVFISREEPVRSSTADRRRSRGWRRARQCPGHPGFQERRRAGRPRARHRVTTTPRHGPRRVVRALADRVELAMALADETRERPSPPSCRRSRCPPTTAPSWPTCSGPRSTLAGIRADVDGPTAGTRYRPGPWRSPRLRRARELMSWRVDTWTAVKPPSIYHAIKQLTGKAC